MEGTLNRKEFEVLVAAVKGECEGVIPQSLIDKGFINGREITQTGKEALEPYKAKRAVFIAAGYGERLRPVTINTPKPLVRVHGKRIIDGLIDACIAAEIPEIIIVRGYLGEQFDQLKLKYPQIKFVDNPYYSQCNNISSAYVVRNLLQNAYVFEADLLVSNPAIVCPYHFSSDFLAIKAGKTEDWCFSVENGVIVEEKIGGTDCWQMVGISYWDAADGKKLEEDIPDVFSTEKGKKAYWEQVPLVFRKDRYNVAVKECHFEDIVEIDTFDELKAIDNAYKTEQV